MGKEERVNSEEYELSDVGKMWFAELPGEIKPHNLAKEYPRICNRMAEFWRQPVEMDRYFDDLVQDNRGSRQGFPLSVVMDISTLRDYYENVLYPKTKSIQATWDPRHRV